MTGAGMNAFAKSVTGRLRFAALAIAALSTAAQAASKVTRVVVYPDRAQVTRVQSVACGARAAADFAELPPSADPRSLRAQAGAARVEGIEVQERSRSEAFSPRAAELQVKIRGVLAEQEKVRDAQAKARAQARTAQQLGGVAAGQISRELAQPAPDLKQWGSALDQSLAARLRAAEAEQRAQVRLRELERELGELARKRDAYAEAAGRTERYAKVLLSCAAGETAQVELTYLVGGAAWSPSYEARAHDDGSADGSVDLTLFATVTQSTGEPWTQAAVTLSTAIPRQDATPPELVALRIFADPREPPKKILVRRDEEQRHADDGRAVAGELAPGGAVAAQGLSVQFVSKDPADVPGDGTPARLKLAVVKLQAAFAWRTLPSQLPYVFRVADLGNGAPFPLLPGPVDLFRKGGLAGHTALERVAEGARFHLAFGLEEQVRVKRIVVEEIARDTGIFSKGRRFRFAYAFELQSFLPGASEIELSDHLPVSELDDVEVGLDEKTTPGYQLKKDDGIVTWKVKLGAGEKKRVDLLFHVDVPQSYDSGGL